MKIRSLRNKRGVTLIELLVVLVISGIVVGGIYRVFVAQTKAYTVQDQVVEVQQNIRSAMELLLRDLRMAGYDDVSLSSTVTVNNPIVVDPADNSHVTLSYEHYDPALGYQLYIVEYWRDADKKLWRRWTRGATQTTETILDNVDELNFKYDVDTNGDGAIENWEVSAAGVGTSKIFAVRVQLTARPEAAGAGDDRFKMVTPRTLTTRVALRNLCLR